MNIKQILIHDNYNYNHDHFPNDIALLQLDKPLELTPFVRTVCLPEKDEGDLAVRDKYGIATGWGVTRALMQGEKPEKGDLSKALKHASFKIQSDQLCRSSCQYPDTINSTVMLCAGDEQGKSDSCHGDSGGDFVREAERGQAKRWAWVAVGLVSWGEGCAQEKGYGYYTRVYPFIDWIGKNLKKKTLQRKTKSSLLIEKGEKVLD